MNNFPWKGLWLLSENQLVQQLSFKLCLSSQFFPSKTNKEQQWYFWSFTWPSCPWFFEHSSKQRSLRRLLTFCSWKNPAKVSWMEGKGRFFEDTQKFRYFNKVFSHAMCVTQITKNGLPCEYHRLGRGYEVRCCD